MTIQVVGQPAHEQSRPGEMSMALPGSRFPLALVVASTAVIAAQRWYAQNGHDLEDVWLGFALTVSMWSWLCLVCYAAMRHLPRFASLTVMLLAAVVFYLSLCAELAYAHFYSAAQDRELSLLSMGLVTGLRVLFGKLLTPRATGLLAGLVVLVHLAALSWARLGPKAGFRKLGFCIPPVLTALTLFGGYTIHERIRSPLADVGRELVFLATTPRLDVKSAPRLPFEAAILDRATPDDPSHVFPFDYVLVFVMETMITRDFKDESSKLKPETFVHSALPHTHRYSDYHSNNQDSRTGMLDMLQSRVIPYEAYADGVDHYAFVSRLPSLVDRFNARGYESAYVVSHADREDVISDLSWKQVTLLPTAEVDALRDKLLCVTIYDFEYGCEDRAILPKVFRLLDEHPKAFVYQEFIWGHDPEYNEITGRSNADYYSSYLDAVVEHLRETNKLDRTLIVLTSDHGYRGRSTLAERYAYHIPLWFYSTRFSAREDARLYSHISFERLLLHEMGITAAPSPEPFVAVIGPTGINSLTVLDATGDLALIRARGDSHFLLSQKASALNPGSYARLLESYRAYFDGLAQ